MKTMLKVSLPRLFIVLLYSQLQYRLVCSGEPSLMVCPCGDLIWPGSQVSRSRLRCPGARSWVRSLIIIFFRIGVLTLLLLLLLLTPQALEEEAALEVHPELEQVLRARTDVR